MASWQPILTASDNRYTAAWDAIEAITGEISALPAAPAGATQALQGHEGCLLQAYRAAAHGEWHWLELAAARLNTVIDSTQRTPRWLGLYGGLSGLGWTVQHLAALAGDPSAAEAADAVDRVLLRWLAAPLRLRIYDLIEGLVGMGVYFLERLPSDIALDGLSAILGHLESSAEKGASGVAWFTGPELLGEWQRQLNPNGHYNLGVAHGAPGVIHFLAELAASDAGGARAKALLEGAVQWLLAQRNPDSPGSQYHSWVTPGSTAPPRLAWCYGDLGIGAVLCQVARRFGRPDWRAVAMDILERCLERDLEHSAVLDAGLCHGAAGVAHIYNRLYQSEGGERFREAALYWFDRVLEMRQPGSGIGGYSAMTRARGSNPMQPVPNPSFLEGSVGIALALLAAVSPKDPGWDRLLLLSGRSGGDRLN